MRSVDKHPGKVQAKSQRGLDGVLGDGSCRVLRKGRHGFPRTIAPLVATTAKLFR